MNKPSALIDIDGTIYNGYTIMDLALNQQKCGLLENQTINELFEIYRQYKIGNFTYEHTAHKALVVWGEGLKGKNYKNILDHAIEYFDRNDKLFSFAVPLIELLKTKGFIPIIVTGEPQFIGEYFCKRVGASSFVSSEYKLNAGTFIGGTLYSLGTSDGKKKALARHDVYLPEAAAFGDSEGDVDMLKLAKYSFCINPSPGLLTIAKERKWEVTNESNILERVKSVL